jgi:glycerol-1-phosphate dehydrogenase [NAD(P)+]
MNTLHDLDDFLSRDSSALADLTLQCPTCGRPHVIPYTHMQVGRGLIDSLPALLDRLSGRPLTQVCVVYDRVIEDLVRERVIQPLTSSRLKVTTLPLGAPGLLLDSEIEFCDGAAAQVPPGTQLLIGAGSGVICDITKWIATRTKIPHVSYGTAPSMNAYTSITATITEQDVKISHLLDPALAVLLDVDIQTQSPMPMIHAGIGDLAARAICNADWRMAAFLRGVYFCPVPYQMTAANEARYLSAAGRIKARDPQALHELSEAILLSGLSMTVLGGETSPSSGAEHILSHFWDLLYHVRGLPKNLHGAQVGVGTYFMLNFYEVLRQVDPARIDPQAVLRRRPSVEALETENRRLYGNSAGLFDEAVRHKRIPDAAFVPYLRGILDNWEALWQAVAPYAPPVESIRAPLAEAGVPLTLASIQRTRAEGLEALVKGPQYRTRYTILDLAWELGILEEVAEETLTRAGE